MNIRNVPKIGLCTSCGSCAGICSNSAIEMVYNKGTYVPEINESLCSNCELCLRICPGYHVDFVGLNLYIFSKRPTYLEIGNFNSMYMGYSLDENVRRAGQSGGLVSALLIHALRIGIIDGAVVTRMDPNNPFNPQTFVAKSEEEIIEASKSKYCPVPTNKIFKDLKKIEGKFAFVGIPCQIHGLRKTERIISGIKRKIVLHFGLFCGRNLNFYFQDYILSLIKARKANIKEFVYRDKEWKGYPGDMRIRLKDDKVTNLDNRYRVSAMSFFTPWRCFLCFDKLNQLADISFGDAWLPGLFQDKRGTSMIISRTDFAQVFLNESRRRGVIELEPIGLRDIVRAQQPQEKYLSLKGYFQISKLFGKQTPRYGFSINEIEDDELQNTLKYAILDFLSCELSGKPFARKMANTLLHRF